MVRSDVLFGTSEYVGKRHMMLGARKAVVLYGFVVLLMRPNEELRFVLHARNRLAEDGGCDFLNFYSWSVSRR